MHVLYNRRNCQVILEIRQKVIGYRVKCLVIQLGKVDGLELAYFWVFFRRNEHNSQTISELLRYFVMNLYFFEFYAGLLLFFPLHDESNFFFR